MGPSTSVPADLNISVGGKPAAIVGFNPNAYDLEAPPFPLQSAQYVIPAGSSGSSSDVTVTTSSGTTIAERALTYLPSPRIFPLAGSTLVQGIYDPVRDLYYFTDTNCIRVFSLTKGTWLPPITIPAPVGTVQRLWGIALPPNGNELALADAGANVIYVVDPANPSSVKTLPFAPSGLPQGVIDHPVGISISDAGVAYITAYVNGGSGYSAFFKLDTNTGVLTDYHLDGPDLYLNGFPEDIYLRTEISADNSTVFFNADGGVFAIDTATDKVLFTTVDQNCCYGNYDLALSKNQTRLEASSYLYDLNLNAGTFLVLNDRESKNTSYVYGNKLSPDGSLLFEPSTSGIDIFDGQTGILLTRLALPFALSANYDALVADGNDNVLIGITGAGDGIAVLDLTSVSKLQPLPLVKPSSLRLNIDERDFMREVSSMNGQLDRGANLSTLRPPFVPHVIRQLAPYPIPRR